jgi:glycosyltransferase involved in cell wall biosynthesis
MRILTALTYYRPHYSGLTVYAERLAHALVRRGHQVTVLTARFAPDLLTHELRDGVRIIRPRVMMRISKGVIMPSMPYWAWRQVHWADIVHLHLPQLDAAPIAMLGRVLKKPVILTYHCDLHLPSGFVHRLATWLQACNHVSARLVDVIVTNTQDYAENSKFLRIIWIKCKLSSPSRAARNRRGGFRSVPSKSLYPTWSAGDWHGDSLATEKG